MKPLDLATSLFVGSIVALAGCGPCENSTERICADTADWQPIGEPFAGVVCGISLDLLVANPAAHDRETFMVRDAKVESVSKQDGGWFTVREGDKTMRVTFKDPRYAVPTDCEGRSAMLQGVFAVKTVPEGESKRRLEVADLHDKAVKIVGEQMELTFVATGVRLSR